MAAARQIDVIVRPMALVIAVVRTPVAKLKALVSVLELLVELGLGGLGQSGSVCFAGEMLSAVSLH